MAVFTAGAVFLAAWLPFNNGLRPEPLIALGVMVTWMLVERAIALRRLAPAAVAIVVAMLTATLAPQGLIAVAALLTGARAIAQTIRRRRATDGLLAPLLVLAASLSLILVVVFRSQTLATVAESARIKYKVGPTIAWYQDWLRYYFLTVESNPDGSMTRRFAVLVLLLCLFGMLVVLLRRGRVPGLASGPAWRLIGTTAVGLLLLTFTPTKWAVQFGAFAGLAGALGAVTAFAVARIGLHSRRNLTLYVTALLFVLAVGDLGHQRLVLRRQLRRAVVRHPAGHRQPPGDVDVPDDVDPDRTAGRLVALPHGLRRAHRSQGQPAQPRPGLHAAAGGRDDHGPRRGRLAGQGRRRSATRSTPPPRPTWRRSHRGCRPPAARWPTTCWPNPTPMPVCCNRFRGSNSAPTGPLGGINPVGFKPEGVGDDLRSYPVVTKPGVVNSDASPNKPNATMSDSAGTAGGKGPVGVNGSHAALPFGLDPARTPVMGSYGENSLAATATSAWYQLPPRSPDRPLVVVSAAGAIWSYKEDGTFTYGQSLKLQWGVARPDGTTQPLGEVQPIDIGPQPAWRNLRFPLTWAPPEANVARIVAYDPNLSSDQWFAFTPPRVPVLQTLQQLIGSQTPGADGHRDRRQLPVPAAVLRTPWRCRTSAVPHPARSQTDGGVVERVAGQRDRRSVPVHSGAAAYLDDLDVPARRLVSRLGIGRAVLPAGAGRSGAGCRHRTGCDHRARLEPARTD